MAQKHVKRKNPTKQRLAHRVPLASTIAKVDAGTQVADFQSFKAGDTVKVSVRIKEGDKERIQAFEGVVIKKKNQGVHSSFCVRKISHGVGVERVFLINSPKIADLEVLSVGRVRRAKLYYLRQLEGKAAKITRDIKGTVAAQKIAAERKGVSKKASKKKKAAEAKA